MRYPSASSAIDTEVRILRSSSTRAMVGMKHLFRDGSTCCPRPAKKLGRNVSIHRQMLDSSGHLPQARAACSTFPEGLGPRLRGYLAVLAAQSTVRRSGTNLPPEVFML